MRGPRTGASISHTENLRENPVRCGAVRSSFIDKLGKELELSKDKKRNRDKLESERKYTGNFLGLVLDGGEVDLLRRWHHLHLTHFFAPSPLRFLALVVDSKAR
jgi:hypothetical protein